MQYAEVLRRSPWAANISLGLLRQYASRLAEALPEDADVQEFAGLVSRAATIAGK